MKDEYELLTDEEKLRHWEAVIAHKIRSQAEVSENPGIAISDEFIAHCLAVDSNFLKFTPLLSLTFPELKKYVPEDYRMAPVSLLKKWTLISALILFAGIQVILMLKSGMKALIFIGIVNCGIGSVYAVGILLNRKLRKMYRRFAERTGLAFRYSKGGLPGFLYDPSVSGIYNGLNVDLSFRTRWTGRWSHGQIGLGQPQIISRSILTVKLRGPLSQTDQKNISELMKRNRLNGELSFENKSLYYNVIGAINSEKMQEELIKALDSLTGSLSH